MRSQSQPRHRRLAATNSVVLAVLRSPMHRLLDGSVCELQFVSRRGQRRVALPVMYAESASDLVVLVGGARGKSWWRSFMQPYPVDVRLLGTWRAGTGRTVRFGEPGRAAALDAYRQRYPDVPVDDADPFVVITIAAP
jgi:hypothetical protein